MRLDVDFLSRFLRFGLFRGIDTARKNSYDGALFKGVGIFTIISEMGLMKKKHSKPICAAFVAGFAILYPPDAKTDEAVRVSAHMPPAVPALSPEDVASIAENLRLHNQAGRHAAARWNLEDLNRSAAACRYDLETLEATARMKGLTGLKARQTLKLFRFYSHGQPCGFGLDI